MQRGQTRVASRVSRQRCASIVRSFVPDHDRLQPTVHLTPLREGKKKGRRRSKQVQEEEKVIIADDDESGGAKVIIDDADPGASPAAPAAADSVQVLT